MLLICTGPLRSETSYEKSEKIDNNSYSQKTQPLHTVKKKSKHKAYDKKQFYIKGTTNN